MIDEDNLVEYLEEDQQTYDDIKEKFNVSRKTAWKSLEEIGEHYNLKAMKVNNRGKKAFYIPDDTIIEAPTDVQERIGKNEFSVGVTGDMHWGNKYCFEEEFEQYLKDLEDSDAELVLMAGDLVDGVNVYRGQDEELARDKLTLDEQVHSLDELLEKYDLEYRGITGNHENKSIRDQNAHPLKYLDALNEQFDFLGDISVNYELEGTNWEISHSHGSPRTPGYRILTMFDERNPTDFPDVALIGHLHSAVYTKHQGVHAMEVGNFMGRNKLSRKYGWSTQPAAWIVDVAIEDDEIKEFVPKLQDYSHDKIWSGQQKVLKEEENEG